VGREGSSRLLRGEERMAQSLLGSDAAMMVQNQERGEEVAHERVVLEAMSDPSRGPAREQWAPIGRRINLWPRGLCRSAEQPTESEATAMSEEFSLEDEVQLGDLTLPGKEHPLLDHFPQDTADGPEVHSRRVTRNLQEDLRRSIVQMRDLRRPVMRSEGGWEVRRGPPGREGG
jgi:hypothetical protein